MIDETEMCCRYCGKDMGNDPSDPPCPCSGETWGHCAIPRDEDDEAEAALAKAERETAEERYRDALDHHFYTGG